MADEQGEKWLPVKRLLLIPASFVCACSVTITLPNSTSSKSHSRHPQKSQVTIRHPQAEDGVVSADWMLRYRTLEQKYGEIHEDAAIVPIGNRFIVAPKVREHHDQMMATEKSNHQ